MRINKLVIFFVLSIVILSSCGKRNTNDTGLEYAPQMYVSKPYEPYSQVEKNSINPDGLNMRKPPKGAIPRRGFSTTFTDEEGNKYADYMFYKNIPNTDEGREYASANLKNPFKNDSTAILNGKGLYLRYCTHCHGAEGNGKGPVAEKYPGIANLSKGSALSTLSGGHIFHVITHGKGRMWPHGSQISPDERWKIVSYVQKEIMKQGEAEKAETEDTEQENENTEEEATEEMEG